MDEFKCLSCEENICVHRVPIFAHLEKDELLKISSLIKRRNYRAEERVFSLGDRIQGLYILRYGSIKLVRYSRDGSEVVFETLGVGDFYGGDQFFQSSRAREDAITQEDTGVCFIGERDLVKIIKANPDIAIKIIQVLSQMHSDDRSLISILSEKDALKRLAHYLLWKTEGKNNLVEITQDELARRISLTHETVSRKLKELREAGFVSSSGYGRIEIINRDGLLRFINA